MTAYRMYFSVDGRIGGRQDFEADDDVAAIRIARVLYDTCSDISGSFELWQGKRQIPAQQAHHPRASLTDLIEAHQRVTIEREEVISRSKWIIARSRRLIETLDHIKSEARGNAHRVPLANIERPIASADVSTRSGVTVRTFD